MENVHLAIAWYQTKIGSYDKQLWEQSVEKRLQKQPPFVLHNAPRKKVSLKTEYIDVDLIRGSTFTKTKPQVPWVYITRKAVARVMFFPFYYTWWVHQTSKRLYALLLVLYILQVVAVIVYLRNFDHSIMEDEMCFTEVILPTILMFLLCLIHSQTVLAHINHKPPKLKKNISEVTRKPHPKKTSRKGRSSGNNSTCQEDGGNTDTSRSSRRRAANQRASDANLESQSLSAAGEFTSKKNLDPVITSSIDMEKNLMSRSVSDYELKPATSSTQNDLLQSASSTHQHHVRDILKSDAHVTSGWHGKTDSSLRKQKDHHVKKEEEDEHVSCVHIKSENQKEDSTRAEKSGGSYTKQNNVSNPLKLDNVHHNTSVQCGDEEHNRKIESDECSDTKLGYVNLNSAEKFNNSETTSSQCRVNAISENERKTVEVDISHGSVDRNRVGDRFDISKNVNTEDKMLSLVASETGAGKEKCASSNGVLAKTRIMSRAQTNEDVDLGLDLYQSQPSAVCIGLAKNISDTSAGHAESNQCTRETFTECHSGSDNLSMSDFVVVHRHVAHETHSSDQGAPSTDLATCSFIQDWKNDSEHHSSVGATAAHGEAHHAECSTVSFKPRPLKSQDSSDSGINNEVLCMDCGCVSPHRDTETCSAYDCAPDKKWPTISTSGLEDVDGVCLNSGTAYQSECDQATFKKQSVCGDASLMLNLESNVTKDSSSSLSDSNDSPTVKVKYSVLSKSQSNENVIETDHQSGCSDFVNELQRHSQISFTPSVIQDENHTSAKKSDSQSSVTQNLVPSVSESSSQLQCFSELFVQEILNEDTLREMSCSSLLVHSDLENSSSSAGRLSTASSSASNSSSCCKMYKTDHIPLSTNSSLIKIHENSDHHHHLHHHHKSIQKQRQEVNSHRRASHEKIKFCDDDVDDKNDPLDESLEHINASDGERPSDDVSNYNPSDSDADSDGPVNEDVSHRYEEKWKRLRFQDHAGGSDSTGKITTSKASTNIVAGASVTKAGSESVTNGNGSRSVVGILTRKPSPLKDLAIVRKSSNNVPVTNSSGSDQGLGEPRSQLRRRRRTSGTPTEPAEANRTRNVPTTLGLRPSETKNSHISSSENETGGAHTPEGSNKATMSSEEWEDRMQSDETTSSAYSSNSEVDSEEKGEEEEKTEYTTSTLHVINLLQPGVKPSCVPPILQQSGSPSSSGNITQPDRVSCMIWEANECKKVDLTALDIGWAIIDKVDSLPESSDYFLIGLLFSFIISMVPLVFRAYVSKDGTCLEDFLSWSGLMAKLIELPTVIMNSYSWRQYLWMVNGILQRFFLSLIFFFLLSVADRTFKQRLLYAKHFSYLTSSRRARKFSMPHFRLNKVRNIKIWLSLRSYLKRRGPQRSVDVIVSACFLCAVCTVCLISLQMLKDTQSFLDYLCNWELMVWCTALGVFLMRFMTVGLKINKKYRNLSVLITEQINLYLQMEQKPHKKEELILANNVLRLAEDLLKELESPFKISGFSANPLIYNIMRVVVLSAFSAVLTEVLGFKLKLHKIKLKA